jgi:hypothetical protein
MLSSMLRACLFSVVAVSLCSGQVRLPDPAKTDHPGADVAPASSPLTYSDEAGLARRRQAVLNALAMQDLGAYRRGFFSGGDPGKYLPGHAMARLLVNPDDPEPARYMNDERSFKEHYHFAAVNWARFLPMFGGAVLTDDTQRKLADEAFRYSAYLTGGGTENHKTMWVMAANVLPHHLAGERGLAHKSREETIAIARGKLRDYVKGLFAAGSGEWDSSTYTMFTLHGLLNIYDFSPDPEARLIAKAGLDWITSYYALKYTDGLFCPPNQRGYYERAFASISDQTGYVWWGGDHTPAADQMRGWRYSIHALTSAYRPSAVTTRIATRQLTTLPIELRNSKPNYWYGLNQTPQPNVYQETLYIDRGFTMGSLWRGHGSQMSRLGIAIATDDGGVLVSGGHPRKSDHTGKKIDFSYSDGTGRYTQAAQVGPAYICLANTPDDDPFDYLYVTVPPIDGVAVDPIGDWLVMSIGDVTVAVRGIGGQAVLGETDLTDRQKADNDKDAAGGNPPRHAPRPLIRVPGRKAGFVIEVLATADRAAIALALDRTSLDVSRWSSDMTVSYRTAAGRSVEMRFNPDPQGDRHADRHAEVSIDGERVAFDTWPIASGPYVSQTPGRLTVNDGREGFEIDFTGDLPVYRAWASQ